MKKAKQLLDPPGQRIGKCFLSGQAAEISIGSLSERKAGRGSSGMLRHEPSTLWFVA